jgi:hypothetical protein
MLQIPLRNPGKITIFKAGAQITDARKVPIYTAGACRKKLLKNN